MARTSAVRDFPLLVSARSFRALVVAVVMAAAAALFAASAVAPASSAGGASVDPYAGLGTWVDVYDRAQWAEPERAIETMSLYGVATLFLQTSNYRRAEDVVRPDLVARFIAAAHDRGINVVGWYLPSLADPVRDLRRALRAAQFRTVDGDGFDSFALDIEARVIRSPWRRTVSLLRLSTSIRRALGASYALGAIVPSGRRMRLDPGYWPGFPYRGLARSFDVFLPMTYFAYGPKGARGRADTIEDVGIIRRKTNDPAVPIHIIGGLASLARTPEVNAFASTASGCGVLGMSLYDFAGTIAHQWAVLSHVTGSVSPLARSCR
jgi:hypothetical protein